MTKSLSDDRASEFNTAVDTNSDGFAGIFVLIALILLMFGWMWLKSYSLTNAPQRFSVTFHNVAGLLSNAAVNVNGVRVGSVERLTLKGKDKVLVDLKVTGENQQIPQGSTFDILSSGVVGAKYIEITLPEQSPNQKLPPLDQNTEVTGNDPVRVEVVVNKIAKEFEDFDFKEAHERVNAHMDTFAHAADKLIVLTDKLTPAANRAVDVENKFGDLATEMRGTTRRMNRILDNPNLSADLKETAQRLKETAQSVGKTMHELNQTLADKPLRQDLLTAMDRLNDATIHIQKSVASVEKISDDKSLRTDIQHIITSLNQTMDKADKMLSNPQFGTDMRGTLGDVRDTIRHLDLAAKQMNSILGHKHPLVQMIFGSPGSVKNADKFDRDAQAFADDKSKSKSKSIFKSMFSRHGNRSNAGSNPGAAQSKPNTDAIQKKSAADDAANESATDATQNKSTPDTASESSPAATPK